MTAMLTLLSCLISTRVLDIKNIQNFWVLNVTVHAHYVVTILGCCGWNFSGSGAHGVASASKRTALKNFANSRIVSGLLKGNRIPDVRQLQKSMKLLKVSLSSISLSHNSLPVLVESVCCGCVDLCAPYQKSTMVEPRVWGMVQPWLTMVK